MQSYKGFVVVDEAYIDFSETASLCTLVNKYPRLIVMQTVSKGFGLAGIRLGSAFGDPRLIQVLNNVKAPYNINKLTAKVRRELLHRAYSRRVTGVTYTAARFRLRSRRSTTSTS